MNEDSLLTDALVSLKQYCEVENFRGWDPYDGLNSRLLHAIPFLDRSALARLVVIQGFKRSPVNLRRFVPRESGTANKPCCCKHN